MALEADRWSRWLLERRDAGTGDRLIGLAALEEGDRLRRSAVTHLVAAKPRRAT